jgi:hypothetical protein
MPEWLKGADCKSASESLRWFESISTHHFLLNDLGSRKAPFFVGASGRRETLPKGRPGWLCAAETTHDDPVEISIDGGDKYRMKVTLNSRLVPSSLRTPVERLIEDHSTRPLYLLIAYRHDPGEEVVVAVEPEEDSPLVLVNLREIRRAMEEGVRGILNQNGALNLQNLKKTDGRIWVKSPLSSEAIDGRDVEFSFGGNPLLNTPDGASRGGHPGTLTCTGVNNHGEISVRLVTNQPLEDENGREVYHVELDQPSIDSLQQDQDDGRWIIRLPDRYRSIR